MSNDVEQRAELKAAVERLRYSNPEKFYTMCKMHLTFSVNLPNDELSSFLDEKTESRSRRVFSAFQRKIKTKGEIFGAPLTQEGIAQLYQLILFLGRDHNIKQEGLFRKTGKLSRQQALRQLLNQGLAVDLDNGEFSVHDCASVLKTFLGELPEPLLTEGHYQAHCQVPDMYKENMLQREKILARAKQIKTVQLLFVLLPRENYQLLGELLTLLHRVTRVEGNKMCSENLATMFAPHILCPKKMSASELQNKSPNMTKAVSFMIENAPILFQVPVDLARDISLYWKEKEKDLQKFKQENRFNKCNGYGTPSYLGNRKHNRSKSLGDQLKKRFPFRSLKMKNPSTSTNITTTSFDDLDISASSGDKKSLMPNDLTSQRSQVSKRSLKSETVQELSPAVHIVDLQCPESKFTHKKCHFEDNKKCRFEDISSESDVWKLRSEYVLRHHPSALSKDIQVMQSKGKVPTLTYFTMEQ